MDTPLLKSTTTTYASASTLVNHHPATARLLDRAGSFNPHVDPDPSTKGLYNISRVGGNWRQIYWDDLFHTVIHTNTIRMLSGIFLTYTAVVFFFATLYYSVSQHDEQCHVGISTLMEAYIFSVETIMTIGYGAPTNDIFYGGCSSMALLLTVESVSGIFLDSLCFGVFFVRFSRATRRATSVVFSKHAVVQQIHGEYCVLFQVCERRRHQLVEAHVRCYGVAKRHSDAPFQTLPMRIQSPDDNLGAFVLLALPQLIVHRIDPSSPLFPPPASSSSTSSVTQCEIAHHVAQSDLELVVVLEGTDATSGNTMQARYSYTADDIKWHHTFAPCVSRDPVTHGAVVDFDLFHTLVPAPPCPSTVV